MSEQTTTGGGSGQNEEASLSGGGPGQLGEGGPGSTLASTNRTIELEQLGSARGLLTAAERACAVLRDAEVRDRELYDALSRIQEAHGLLWQLSRRYSGQEELTHAAPLTMSIDYVAWILADRKVDHWTAELLRLMAKSDPGHRGRLAQAFPEEAAALEAWAAAPFGDVANWRQDRV